MPTAFRWFLVLGGVNAALGVALAAAGAHALKTQLTGYEAELFRTALEYHQYHALGLVLVGLAGTCWSPSVWFRWSGWLMLAGIVLFSGNLYLRSLAGFNALHAVTPFGGGAFILSWVLFAVGALRAPRG
jgi:uncharacterized membrane protein YgdD (TMEM256/DUF423 family)